jgi:Smg protein
MKEAVIDVLVFLFDNYLSIETDDLNDEFALAGELEDAGFSTGEINKAFDWLSKLDDLYKSQDGIVQQGSNSVRVLTQEERQKLDVECEGFLFHLQQIGSLDTMTREIIIESAVTLGIDRLSLAAFKRIIGLVMLNSPTQEELPMWAEDLIFENEELVLH